MNIYDIEVLDKDNNVVKMDKYKGKVLLIVNTATGCGFTPQYSGLQKLYETYQEQGFEVLDFPCNQFGNQAPGTIDEISDFCALKYNTTFPLFAKVDVNGDNQAEIFKYLKESSKSVITSRIKWNFTKFLVDKNGKVVERFAPLTPPEKIEQKIKMLLK